MISGEKAGRRRVPRRPPRDAAPSRRSCSGPSSNCGAFSRRNSRRARTARRRWRSDPFLDVGFNLALVVMVVGIFAAAWLLLKFSGFTSVSDDAVSLFSTAAVEAVRRVAPSLPLYLGAATLLAGALGFWWWAERGSTS